jgi:DNA-directed RNA polymerase subunit M
LRKLKFCPKCGSKSVFWASGLPQLWSLWECKNCGYRGALILEDGKMAEKIEEEWEKKHVAQKKRLNDERTEEGI